MAIEALTLNSSASHDGPRRVLYVEYGADFGGAAISLAELVGCARDMDVEPVVLTFQRRQIHDALFGGIRSLTVRRRIDYTSRATLASYLGRRRALRWLRPGAMKAYALADYLQELYLSWVIVRVARREGVDLIHSNNAIEHSALRAAAWAGVPCVAHMRGVITERTERTLRTQARLVEKAFAGAIAVSSWVYETGLRHGLTPEQMVTIHNPVDPALFDGHASKGPAVRKAMGFAPEHVVLGCFGRVNRFKGQKEFLEAAAAMAADVPEARFLIVGDPSDSVDEAYWKRIQEMASEPALAGRVVFAGYQEDVHAYFHACDVVVHSALGAEGFGRVVLEGMVCRKPVIATDSGGPRDIVTPEVDGLLVPPGAVPELAAAMLRLARDQGLRARMGKAGREKVDREFSSRHIASQVGAFYASILARGGGG
jgi:glycosyltransferase involved in cell wall biosynthesis